MESVVDHVVTLATMQPTRAPSVMDESKYKSAEGAHKHCVGNAPGRLLCRLRPGSS